jgi:hypothetical protein
MELLAQNNKHAPRTHGTYYNHDIPRQTFYRPHDRWYVLVLAAINRCTGTYYGSPTAVSYCVTFRCGTGNMSAMRGWQMVVRCHEDIVKRDQVRQLV